MSSRKVLGPGAHLSQKAQLWISEHATGLYYHFISPFRKNHPLQIKVNETRTAIGDADATKRKGLQRDEPAAAHQSSGCLCHPQDACSAPPPPSLSHLASFSGSAAYCHFPSSPSSSSSSVAIRVPRVPKACHSQAAPTPSLLLATSAFWWGQLHCLLHCVKAGPPVHTPPSPLGHPLLAEGLSSPQIAFLTLLLWG